MLSAAQAPRAGRRRANGAALLAFAAALTLGPILGGCSGSMIADHMPTAVGGLPEDAPERPATELPYPAVHNMPPARATVTLTNDQQKRLQDDLIAERNRVGDAPSTAGSNGNSSAAAARNP
jgi:hypothetical protein